MIAPGCTGPESVGASEGFLGWVAYLGAANAGVPLSIIVKQCVPSHALVWTWLLGAIEPVFYAMIKWRRVWSCTHLLAALHCALNTVPRFCSGDQLGGAGTGGGRTSQRCTAHWAPLCCCCPQW